MSQKQLDPHAEFGPSASSPLSGNKEAQAAADKVKAALDAIPVDRDALLLAERNDVLDAAIERLDGGEKWVVGDLFRWGDTQDEWLFAQNIFRQAQTESKWSQSEIYEDTPATKAIAAVTRQYGKGFCLIGALGAEEGLHSHAAIDEAVTAVSKTVGREDHYAYGYTHGGVFNWNDSQASAGPVIEALKAAKSEPLSKSYNE